jgi:hypothetical protein
MAWISEANARGGALASGLASSCGTSDAEEQQSFFAPAAATRMQHQSSTFRALQTSGVQRC